MSFDRMDMAFDRAIGQTRRSTIVGQVMGGMWQIVTTGTAQQRAEAAEILTETRRRLYQLLADGDPE